MPEHAVAPLTLAVNARPLLTPLTGIGRYVRSLMEVIERDPDCQPQYFYSFYWQQGLSHAVESRLGPGLIQLGRITQVIRPAIAALEQVLFQRGLQRKPLRLYFEPAYLPYRSHLPTAITIHDLSHVRCPHTHPLARVRLLSEGLPKAVARAAVILTVSEFTRREVLEFFGLPPQRVIATPLGVDARFAPYPETLTSAYLRRLGLTHGRYCLAVGTLEPRKNLVAVVHAHSRLPAALRAAYPLVVVGMKGWHTEPIVHALERAASSGRVRLLGRVEETRLPWLYAGASLLAYPSLYEGFGLPPLEAMASGVPVIASNRASLPEVIGDAGLLLEPEDIPALSEALRVLLEDRAQAAALAIRGRQRAATFTWARCAALTKAAWWSIVE